TTSRCGTRRVGDSTRSRRAPPAAPLRWPNRSDVPFAQLKSLAGRHVRNHVRRRGISIVSPVTCSQSARNHRGREAFRSERRRALLRPVDDCDNPSEERRTRMKREHKIGIAVTCTFLCLAGAVIGLKMQEQQMQEQPAPLPSDPTLAEAKLPAEDPS